MPRANKPARAMANVPAPLATDGIGTTITDQRPQVVIVDTEIETEIMIEIDAAMVIEIEIDPEAEVGVVTDVNALHRPSRADVLVARTQMLTVTAKRLNRTNALTKRRKRRSQMRAMMVTRQMTMIYKIQFVVGAVCRRCRQVTTPSVRRQRKTVTAILMTTMSMMTTTSLCSSLPRARTMTQAQKSPALLHLPIPRRFCQGLRGRSVQEVQRQQDRIR